MNEVKYYLKDKFPDIPEYDKERIREIYVSMGKPVINMQTVAKIRSCNIPYGMLRIKKTLMEMFPEIEASK